MGVTMIIAILTTFSLVIVGTGQHDLSHAGQQFGEASGIQVSALLLQTLILMCSPSR